MRLTLLILSSLLWASLTSGQIPGHGAFGSDYELVYKISVEEAARLSLKGEFNIHHFRLQDRIPFDTLNHQEAAAFEPKPGFYVRVGTQEQQLKVSLEINQDFEVKKIPDGKWLRFVILDRGMKEVRPKAVYFNNHRVRYNEKIRAYRYRAGKRKGVIRIEHEERAAISPIAEGYRRKFFNRLGSKILYRTPLKVVTKPARDIYRSIKWGNAEGIVRKVGSIFDPYLRDEQTAYGYLLLNKPKYRPGDTLRYKFKFSKVNGRPLKGQVDVKLYSQHEQKYKQKIKLINGQGKGKIVLADSLNMVLDQYSRLTVGNGWNNTLNTRFSYEEYELKTENYKLTLDKEHQGFNSDNLITLSGLDENENRLKNSRYQVTVRTTLLTKNHRQKQQFIPLILFEKSGALDPAEDTEIILPDSIFPQTDLNYLVEVSFRNAANDLIKRTARGRYTYSRPSIRKEMKNDSIYFLFDSTYTRSRFLEVRGLSSVNDTVLLSTDKAPHAIRTNPAISSIELRDEKGDLLETYQTSSLDPGVSHLYDRSVDSLKVNISNPLGVPLWYTVFRENLKIREGFTEAPYALNLMAKNKDSYVIHYRYLWAGEIKTAEAQIDYFHKLLDISIDQQSLVIPGVTDSVRVRVTDHKGRPVAGVDVSAMAITGKFKSNNIPQVPYFGVQAQLNTRNRDYREPYQSTLNTWLNFRAWRKALALDSIAYYQIMRPDDLSISYFDSPGGHTKGIILSMANGYLEPLAYIKVDDALVYIADRSNSSPYSFDITPGYHKVQVRTMKGRISVDSVFFEEGKRTVVSIPRTTTDKRVSRKLGKRGRIMPLTTEEKADLFDHTLAIQPGYYGQLFITDDNTTRQVSSRNTGTLYLGPIKKGKVEVITGNKKYEIDFEPGYVYELGSQTVFKKSIKTRPFTFNTPPAARILSFLQKKPQPKAPSTKAADKPRFFFQERLGLNGYREKPDKGILTIYPQKERSDDLLAVYLLPAKKGLPFEKFDPYLISEMDSGWHEVALIYNDSTFVKERFYLKPKGVTLLSPDLSRLEPVKELFKLLPKPARDTVKVTTIRSITTIPVPTITSGYISGVVIGADDDLPLPQVTVLIKGTNIGVPTNMDGFYTIPAPTEGGTLVFRYLGYTTQEHEIGNQSRIDVFLSPDVLSLGEVVVTGYGVEDASFNSREVSAPQPMNRMLQSRVAGIHAENSARIVIRGLTSVQASQQPLVIIDGVPGSAGSVSERDLKNATFLNAASATAIYGARAANGVLIITTKNGPVVKSQLSNIDFDNASGSAEDYSIRSNFRDYAYWEPSLTTDAQGMATFTVTYPDDITSWNHHFLAMNNKGLSGQAQTSSKAFKPMASRLLLPRFLVQGDSSTLYGEVLSYVGDTVEINRQFLIGEAVYDLKSTLLSSGLVDSLKFVASSPDSIEATYRFSTASLNDGEKRSLPVIRKGMEQTSGKLFVLESDTSFTITPDPKMGLPEINALSNLRGLLLKDIQALHNYGYWCNEQKASKLIALLAEKQLKAKMDLTEDRDRKIRKLIRRLSKAMNPDGGWGWWEGLASSSWVSNHIIRALVMAEAQGFDTKTDLEVVVPKLIDQLPLRHSRSLIESMETLQEISPGTDLSEYLKVVKDQKNLNLTDKLRIMLIDFRISGSVSRDSLLQYERQSALGGLYFDDKDKKQFFNNEVLSSLAAYRLLKAIGGEEDRLSEIRRYLMLNRRSHRLRNTYEAAQIIQTIGADLAVETGQPELLVNGAAVTEFPKKINLNRIDPITIDMQSNHRTYLTVSQDFWNVKPEADSDFAQISTTLVNEKRDTISHLKKGEYASIMVRLTIDESVDFAMLEVPIPAGTTYQRKPIYYGRGKYREYFKEKVNFYFEHLEKGNHTFEIPLSVLFPGNYAMNPARFELMYRPLINGNNELKQIKVN